MGYISIKSDTLKLVFTENGWFDMHWAITNAVSALEKMPDWHVLLYSLDNGCTVELLMNDHPN